MDSSTLLALLAAALLGTAIVLARVGLRTLDPVRGALVSVPSTMLLYWLLALFFLEGGGWNASAFAIFALVGLVFPAVVTLLGFESNRRIGPTVTGTVASTTPLFATLGALVLLGEPLTLQAATGTAAIVLGVIALSWRGAERPSTWAAWVFVLPLAAAAIRGGAQTAVKGGLALWPDPFVAGLIGYTFSTLTIIAANRAWVPARRSGFDRRGVPWFFAAGLCNGMAVLAMYQALNGGAVSIVSPLVATYPLFTLALSAAFLRDEAIGLRVLAGVALTLAGVWVLMLR
jgi:drug/metabolite transporter (DMT)-like permease